MRGVYLTTVGFGLGNYNDVLMEQLANQEMESTPVDNIREAQRIFVEDLSGVASHRQGRQGAGRF